MTIPTHVLNDGRSIPAIGLGTYGLRDDAGVASLVAALTAGYRLLDSAVNYGNEAEVGEAVRSSGVARDEIVVTTKLPGRHHGYDETLRSAEQSLEVLGLDRIDLYLIHWPNPRTNRFVDAWRAMVRLREEGVVSSIGVSNFTPEHLDRIIDATGVVPAVNQIELHPDFPQPAMRQTDAGLGVVTEGYSPLGYRDELTSRPEVVDIAAAHDVTPSQAVLRWAVQLGTVPIPKSGDADRQRENLGVFDFALDDDEMETLSSFAPRRMNNDPDDNEEM